MTTIKFVNGLREIGGTFIEVETSKAKCMFDFGFANAECLDAKLKTRGENYASDLALLQTLPISDGLYDEKTAKRLRVLPYGDPAIGKACFLLVSHMHIDHMAGLSALHPDAPVYMTKDSLTLFRSLEASDDVFGAGHPNCVGLEENEPVTIADIRVTPVPVDHDVVGACGFLIETDDGTICYTGDFRFHGFHPEISRAFASACKGADVLITEGVTVSHDDVDMLSLTAPLAGRRTEYDLLNELTARMLETNGLLIVNPYNRNVERLLRMSDAARQAGRTLVLDDRAARHVAAFDPAADITVYDVTLSARAQNDGLPANWNVVALEDVLAKPERYLLQMDFRDLYALTDLRDVAKAYLHCDGAPLGAYDPSYPALLRILETLQIPYEYCSVGGHAEPYYLRWMIDEIAPKVLAPIHSFRPEQVQSARAARRLLPEKNEVLELPL